jgi:nucleotidyltransferase substrate binding protein (TIGR01987 family)
MNNKDIRWKQRYVNFKKAFNQLKAAINRIDELDNLAKEGLVQRFEYTYELAWKTIKDFIESKGEPEKYQKDILKKAFQLEIIDNGEIWLEMLTKRNLMAHTYNETTFEEIVKDINEKYFVEIQKLIIFFNRENEQ